MAAKKIKNHQLMIAKWTEGEGERWILKRRQWEWGSYKDKGPDRPTFTDTSFSNERKRLFLFSFLQCEREIICGKWVSRTEEAYKGSNSICHHIYF